MRLMDESHRPWLNALRFKPPRPCADCEVVPVFYFYVLFLILSGIAMLILACIRSGQSTVRRLWNGIFGAGLRAVRALPSALLPGRALPRVLLRVHRADSDDLPVLP